MALALHYKCVIPIHSVCSTEGQQRETLVPHVPKNAVAELPSSVISEDISTYGTRFGVMQCCQLYSIIPYMEGGRVESVQKHTNAR